MPKQKTPRVPKWMYWTPRVLSIIFLCFLALFSLDVFEPGLSAGQIALGLLMHNIPVIILGVLLAIAWKYEIVGGIAYNLAGLVYVFFAFTNVPWYMAIAWSIQIAGPAFFIGILFMMNWYKKK